jgi:hypothetical protein
MQFLTLLIEQAARVSRGLQGVTQVRKPHKPHRMLEIIFVADVKSDPTRVRNPAVFLRQTFHQERIANWTRKWYIDGATQVQMPDLGTSETEFPAAKSGAGELLPVATRKSRLRAA